LRVVSNASPLIILGKLGQLGLLFKLYDEVLIPREVYNEVVINGLRLSASDAQAVDFLIKQSHIQVIDVTLPTPLPSWAQAIDTGEIEVIILAQQQAADWAIIDNAHARRAARQMGLRLKGTIGLLLGAFRQHYLSLQEFELLVLSIKAQPSFWISERLCEQALAQARKEARQC
jgi:predicted nucleic acid-binding protein